MPESLGIPVIGIIGGIGSGKSTVAREAARLRPWLVVDADRIGHTVLTHPEIISGLRELFGDGVIGADGSVNRPAVAALVFGPEQQTQRQQLESLVHPEIRREARAQIADAARSGRYQAVILDAAVLLEAGWRDACDAVVFLDTSEPMRQQRVRDGRGWTAEQLRQREASQLPLAEKIAQSDGVIANDGDLSATVNRFVDWVDEWLAGRRI